MKVKQEQFSYTWASSRVHSQDCLGVKCDVDFGQIWGIWKLVSFEKLGYLKTHQFWLICKLHYGHFSQFSWSCKFLFLFFFFLFSFCLCLFFSFSFFFFLGGGGFFYFFQIGCCTPTPLYLFKIYHSYTSSILQHTVIESNLLCSFWFSYYTGKMRHLYLQLVPWFVGTIT